MTSTEPKNQVDRFRGWAVTLFYAALGFFALLILFVTLQMWSYFQDEVLMETSLVLSSIAASILCFRSAYRFYLVMKAGVGIPRLHLAPFLLVMIMIVLASRLFASA